MEATLALVKPDALAARDAIVTIAENAGLFVSRGIDTRLTPEVASGLYLKRESQASFRVLVDFMSSSECHAMVLSGVGAVRRWRALCGPTDPQEARDSAPSSLRALYGTDSLRNAVHASATVADATREIALLFPSGPLDSLSPQDFLLETVMPGLVEALAEMYTAQPVDPYRWLSHWLATSAPPPRDLLQDWPQKVLGSRALKADEWGDVHTESLGAVLYQGAWNFRRCKDRDPVYGAGQCTLSGLRRIMEGLRHNAHRRVLIISLRSEPVVYVGDKPCTVRERHALAGAPVGGAATSGGAFDPAGGRWSLERRERRLRGECAAAAADAGDSLAVSFEESTGEIASRQVIATGRDAFKTFEEAVGSLPPQPAAELLRAPTALPDVAPDDRALDTIADACWRAFRAGGKIAADEGSSVDAALLFICDTGKHRATMGMVIGCLLWRLRNGVEPPAHLMEPPAAFAGSRVGDPDRAEFPPVLWLLRQLGVAERASDSRTADYWAVRALRSLHRYYVMLLFALYAVEERAREQEAIAVRGDPGSPMAYSQWLRQNWGLQKGMEDMVFS
eukprot:PRCOL_00006887-RA